MSRPEYDVKETYLGAGNQSAYTFDFKIEVEDHLLIIEVDDSGVETQRVRGDDVTYLSSVVFDSVEGGGTVNLAANLPTDYSLIILLANDTPTQTFEFRNKTSFTLRRFENALDFLGGAIQRLAYRANQAFRINDLDDEEAFDAQFPPGVEDAADRVLQINSDGDGVLYGPTAGEISSASASASAASDSADAALISETNAAASEASVADLAQQVTELTGVELAQKDFTIDNNASGNNIPGLFFPPATYKTVIFSYDIFRRSTTQSKSETGIAYFNYDNEAGAWKAPVKDYKFQGSGVTFTIDSNGQIRYNSTSYGGTGYIGNLRVKDLTLFTQALNTGDHTILNNTASQIVSGFVYDKAVYSGARLTLDIFRRDDAQSYVTTGFLYLKLDEEADAWLAPVYEGKFNNLRIQLGLTFTLDASGQLLVDSTDFAGGNESGTIRIRNAIEFTK